MWIGEAAQEAGVNVQSLRYYERRGLLPRPPRRASGYRDYQADAVHVVRFIKRAQALGFSLEEIEQLIRLRGVTAGERHRVRAIAERKIAEIDRKLAQLRAMRRALTALVLACRHAGAPACPIVEALAGRESQGSSARSSARRGGAPRAGKE
jgi:Cu(I)-responsive transcriptional regulator